MELETIKCRLNQIFSDRLNLSFDGNDKSDIINENLLGRRFRLKARDLLYIYFDIEKEFDITIPQDAIISNKFTTYQGMVSIIQLQTDNE